MANYKMIIQYDGTRYKGWQRQKTTDQTIQGKIEAILSRQYGRTIEIDGSFVIRTCTFRQKARL